jgi:hypothetical protein
MQSKEKAMTPEQTLDWLAEQHKSQCNEDRPVQEWIRSMKSMLPAPVAQPVESVDYIPHGWPDWMKPHGITKVLATPVQEPESFEQWNAKQHGDPEEIGFLQALRIAYCSGQDSVTKATPPAAQRQWVGLTRAECLQIEKDMAKYYDYRHECKTVCLPEFARAIEAKLKEKNNG